MSDAGETSVRCGEVPPPGRKQLAPYIAHFAPGKYAYCTCGRSAHYPCCDGTHRGTEFRPIKIVLEGRAQMAWCACGRSRAQPYCDGSHARAQ
jgi:CDGSH-type Zn-finger protein